MKLWNARYDWMVMVALVVVWLVGTAWLVSEFG